LLKKTNLILAKGKSVKVLGKVLPRSFKLDAFHVEFAWRGRWRKFGLKQAKTQEAAETAAGIGGGTVYEKSARPAAEKNRNKNG